MPKRKIRKSPSRLEMVRTERSGELIVLLKEFEAMWSGHLERIKAVQHRIELLPDAKPACQPPYRAEPFAREIQKREFKKMLEAGAIEPSMVE